MPENIDTLTPQRARRRGQRMTSAQRRSAQESFLKAFATTANVRAACMKAGISRNIVYEWQEHDETFGFQFRQASEDANDVIRAELFRRAVQGTEKPLVSMGRAIYDKDGKLMTTREYSDTLLSLLAKARMPEFRDKQQVDINASTSAQDMQVIQETIMQALAAHPDAKVAVAQALMGKARESTK